MHNPSSSYPVLATIKQFDVSDPNDKELLYYLGHAITLSVQGRHQEARASRLSNDIELRNRLRDRMGEKYNKIVDFMRSGLEASWKWALDNARPQS